MEVPYFVYCYDKYHDQKQFGEGRVYVTLLTALPH